MHNLQQPKENPWIRDPWLGDLSIIPSPTVDLRDVKQEMQLGMRYVTNATIP